MFYTSKERLPFRRQSGLSDAFLLIGLALGGQFSPQEIRHMSAIIVDLLAAVLLLSASMTLGWWLHCWTQGRASDHSRDARLRLAEEVLTRLDQLATSMTLDLGEHHDRVQRISDELSASVVSRARR